VDPRLFSKDQWTPLSKTLKSSGHILVSVERNIVDAIWDDKPPPPSHVIQPLEIEYTGRIHLIYMFLITDEFLI
jgi:Xaa-Pro aminopeptidase